jgi:hypothetical protein
MGAFDSRWVPPVGGAPSRHTGTGGAADGWGTRPARKIYAIWAYMPGETGRICLWIRAVQAENVAGGILQATGAANDS